ncbi:MAG: glycosyltransferase [Acidobacteria bacterium]|jgi:glycosyltransferase involved in cell wall biosynthesis|nr:MAG: glycosyltransferase [Acidobacteriota bacterium]GIU81090.1 MAG: group 1 glycosyl transferase [Pyrinomonadaceae bacterium]
MKPKVAKIVYVHGHGIHPNRLKLFPSIGSEFIPADHKLPWLHLPNPPIIRKIPSLLLSSIFFPEKNKWDLIIGDNPQHLPVVMKKLRLLRPDQKIVPYLAGEFAYFLATGYYGERKTKRLLNWFLNWDAYLCSGEMTGELVRKVVPSERHHEIFVVPNCVRQERFAELRNVQPKLESFRMVFVGNGPSGFRIHYKGLDLMFEAFKIAKKHLPNLSWTIVGDWSDEVKRQFTQNGIASQDVRWLGKVTSLKEIFQESALYIHCARGDASPNTVVEAMVAGLPALISEWTGTRKTVKEVDERLIAPLDPKAIAERIIWYFSLTTEEKRKLSERSREIVRENHNESKVIEIFQEKVSEMINYLFEGKLTIDRK